MKKQILRMQLLRAISCLFVLILLGCGAPTKVIKTEQVVNCTWPLPPTLTMTPDTATVAQTIQDLLKDKNNLIDYALAVQSTKKCYDESLKKGQGK